MASKFGNLARKGSGAYLNAKQYAAFLDARKDQKRLEWLLAFITAKGSDGISSMLWSLVDPDGAMADRIDLTFDRAAIDAERKRNPKP